MAKKMKTHDADQEVKVKPPWDFTPHALTGRIMKNDNPSSVQSISVKLLSYVRLFVTPWTAACQASLSITTPGAYSNSRPLCQWRHLTISSYVNPFSSRLQSFPASGSFPMSRFFASGSQSIGVSASASVLPMNIQDWYPLGNKLVWSPCSPRDSQEYSPGTQFKSINSSALSFLYNPTVTSIHDYWKNHNSD